MPELITGCELLSPAVPESLNRDVETDLISVLETVRYRFPGFVNFYIDALNSMNFNASGKGFS